ncbi:MAG TPA: hypothetical protein VKG01_17830 [Thermoanaerobaculia bacterium]|nr:hypothetical protein [Thermoanaerobaculia bacterium]
MRRPGRLLLALSLAGAAVLLAAGADVVVLKGGAKVELKKAPERRGSLILLTRADGTLLSVPEAEVDWKATADLRAARAPAKAAAPAAPAAPESPAEAARQGREGPRAKVKLTDADVQHVVEDTGDSGEKEKKAEERSGGARLEVADYTQEKSGANVIVRGELRNVGGTPAVSSRMTVTAMDEKGEKIASAEAGLSNGMIASGATVSFSVTIPIGEKVSASLRFSPQWVAPAAPAPAASPGTASGAAANRPAASPTQAPTPYGLGTLYAPMAAPASTTPPADGNRGYIPGMSSPESQPQPLVTPSKPKS